MYPFLVSFFCLFLLLPVFKREEGLVVILNVFQSACVSMWNKSQKSVYITKATLQFTSVQFLMKLGRVFLWLLTSSSSFLSVNCRGAKKWHTSERRKVTFLSLFFFFLCFSLNEVGEKNWERRTRYYHLVAMKFETKTHDLLSLSFCERAATVWTNQMTRQYFCSSGALVLIRNDNFRPLPGFTYECDYFVPLWKMF